ncbi:MAG: high frequency lysogenization protein HflD [Gammaproteobacteria bacterium]|nr:high frequency lysogenization protein HflD [Gammaproteobacteria bacterium]
MKTDRDRSIALAGLFQSASLASQIARHGMADNAPLEASIHSLLQVDSDSVDAVYGGVNGVAKGVNLVLKQISGGKDRDMEITRYVITLLHLERKLSKKRAMLKQISDGINQAEQRLDHFPLLHPNILAQLADIYASTISTLSPRIMVQGEALHLQNPENVNRIRALLLAGVRSAMLWRQCGGGRLQVLLGRKKLARNIHQLKREMN